MKNIPDSIKNIFNKEHLEKAKDFFIRNIRYFAAVLLFIALLLVLYNCTGPETKKSGGEDSTESETGGISIADFELDKEFEQDANEELNTLITAYFAANAAGDLNALEAVAYPVSDNEKSYIGVFSQYIESYQNVSCYTKRGLTDGSYLVSAYFEMKFYGVDTLAPGLDFFYVETDKDGKLFINNLYSPYNLGRVENELDPNIYSVILKFEQQEDVVALRQEVATKYDEAVASDANLAAMITTTIPNAMRDWVDSVNALEQTTEQGTEQETEQTTEQPTDDGQTDTPDSQQPEENGTDDQQPDTVSVQIISNSVNVRDGSSTDSNVLGKVGQGETFTKLGVDGEWTQIDYNGTTAYVKTEFVQEVTD